MFKGICIFFEFVEIINDKMIVFVKFKLSGKLVFVVVV